MAKKKKTAKRVMRTHLGVTVITLRVTKAELAHMKRMAKKHTEGNVSQWVRMGGMRQRP